MITIKWRQCDLISSQPEIPIYMTRFFEISPTWTSKCLSRLFPLSPNFTVIQQYKTRIVHQTSFKYSFVILVSTTSEDIYENYKKNQKNYIKTIETRNPSELYLSWFTIFIVNYIYCWFIFLFTLTTLITYLLFIC